MCGSLTFNVPNSPGIVCLDGYITFQVLPLALLTFFTLCPVLNYGPIVHGQRIRIRQSVRTRQESDSVINTLRPGQNGRYCADDTFKCLLFNQNILISIRISLEFVPKGPINHIPALDQIMAWHRPGDKPLSEPMMVRLFTHICVISPNELSVVANKIGLHS